MKPEIRLLVMGLGYKTVVPNVLYTGGLDEVISNVYRNMSLPVTIFVRSTLSPTSPTITFNPVDNVTVNAAPVKPHRGLPGSEKVFRVAIDHSDIVQSLDFIYTVLRGYIEPTKMLWHKNAILHCHDWLTAKMIPLIKQMLDIPTIFSVHLSVLRPKDDYMQFLKLVEDWGIDKYDIRAKYYAIDRRLLLEAEGCHAADTVHAVSNAIAREIHNAYDVPMSKIRVIPNGVDTVKYSPCSAEEQPMVQAVLNKYNLKQPFILSAGRFVCAPKSELVLTKSGGMTPIERIEVGDNIYTHKGTFEKVIRKYIRKYSGKIISLYPRLLRTKIRVTPEHPIFVAKRIPCHRGKNRSCKPTQYQRVKCDICKKWKQYRFYWKPSKDLVAGDFVLIPIPKQKNVTSILISDYIKTVTKKGRVYTNLRYLGFGFPDKIILTDKFMRLCGYYVAEGSIHNNKSIELTFGKHETEYIKDVKKILSSLSLTPKFKNVRNTTRIEIFSSPLAKLFENLFGSRAYKKKVPSMFLNLDREKTIAFLTGWFRGDGYSDSKEVAGTTVSQTLAHQIFLMVAHAGAIPRLYKKQAPRTSFTKRTVFIVAFSGEGFGLTKKIGFNIKKRLWTRSLGTNYGGYIWAPLRKVTQSTYHGNVYNLEIAKTNSFCIGGISTHNCEKRHKELILAFKQFSQNHPEYHLAIFGFSGYTRDELFRTRDSLPPEIRDKVKIMDRDVRDDMPYLYKGCDIAAFVSSLEAFGLVALEAMSTGKPVVVGNVGGLREVIDDAGNNKYGTRVDGTDPNSIVEGLERAHMNKDTWGTLAREVVEKKYSWERIAQEYEKMYEELLSRKNKYPDTLIL